jgi:hypothetical protein
LNCYPLNGQKKSVLRLCHELNRYSVDLDFWFIKTVS